MSAAAGDILPPFTTGETWCIYQGYSSGTHVGTSQYGLDLTDSSCSTTGAAGKTVRAPISGTLAYPYQSAYGNLCVNIAGGRSYTLTHINSSITGSVTAGQIVGTVGSAGSYNNNNVAHIHFEIWSSPNCYNSSVIPFDAAHSARICGAADLTASGPSGNGIWGGTTITGDSCGSPTRKSDLAWVQASSTPGQSDAYMIPSNGTGWGAAWTAGGWTDPSNVVAGDFTGDGRSDIAWVQPSGTAGQSNVYMIPSTGSGWGSAWTVQTWGTPSNVVAGDFNGDGRSDLAWVQPSTTSGQSNLYVIPSTGSGWGAAWTMQTWGTPSRVVAGDFTGDGKTDIGWIQPSATSGQSDLYIIPSTGSGWGAAWSVPSWGTPSNVVAGDFNGDGKSDIAWIEPSGTAGLSTVSTIPSTGSGWGSAWTVSGWVNPTNVVAGDFDANGKSDLTWVQPSGTAGQSNVYMIPSTGSGWGASWTAQTWNTPTSVVAGDFNGN
ncbi:MAG TPA: VCBS repeat domain-containing M23 family metallopeptidase [Patescibacteria group bacterium]|nr:VCBS repeat domain-containing M23 family metallopeptidase [Patescibacteria group bacterium]